jgi:hypothetical protein
MDATASRTQGGMVVHRKILRRSLVERTAVLLVLLSVVLPALLKLPSTAVYAASRSSKNVAYINYDDSGFTGTRDQYRNWSGNIFSTSIVDAPAPRASSTATLTYSGITFTPLTRKDVSSATLGNFDTLILFEVCDIATSLSAAQHQAIKDFVAAGNKVLLFDGDRCAPVRTIQSGPVQDHTGGAANYSWFQFPFSTSSPGPRGAFGVLEVVEKSTLTDGLASDPFDHDELGDANTAETADPNWYAAGKTTNFFGNNGFFLAYARNHGLIIYAGADFWATESQTKSLTDLFLNMLRQPFNPDELPSTVRLAPTPISLPTTTPTNTPTSPPTESTNVPAPQVTPAPVQLPSQLPRTGDAPRSPAVPVALVALALVASGVVLVGVRRRSR